MTRAPAGEEEAWEAAEHAAAALGPAAGADPTDFGKSILTVLARSAARPTEVTGAWLSFANALEYTADHCAGRHSQPANYPKRSRGMLSVSAESISRKVSAENVSRTPR